MRPAWTGGGANLAEPGWDVNQHGMFNSMLDNDLHTPIPGAHQEGPGVRQEAPGVHQEAPGARQEGPGRTLSWNVRAIASKVRN